MCMLLEETECCKELSSGRQLLENGMFKQYKICRKICSRKLCDGMYIYSVDNGLITIYVLLFSGHNWFESVAANLAQKYSH